MIEPEQTPPSSVTSGLGVRLKYALPSGDESYDRQIAPPLPYDFEELIVAIREFLLAASSSWVKNTLPNHDIPAGAKSPTSASTVPLDPLTKYTEAWHQRYSC